MALELLRDAAARISGRMPHGHCNAAVHALRMIHGEAPGLQRSPVVADESHLCDPQRIEQRNQVGHEIVDRVVGLARLDLALAATARVERDHAVAGVDQRWNLVAPDRVVVREAVHEQHVGALALDDDVELDIVHPHPAAVDCHVGSGRDQITVLIRRLTGDSWNQSRLSNRMKATTLEREQQKPQ